MENKENYIQVITFINVISYMVRWKKLENNAESKKMGLQFFMMYFDSWISFILSHNTNCALIINY